MVKKFLDPNGLSVFLDNLKILFATKDLATTTTPGLMTASDKKNLDQAIIDIDLLKNDVDMDGGSASSLDDDYNRDFNGGSAI